MTLGALEEPTAPAGVSLRPGVHVNERMLGFLHDLRAAVPSSIPLTVTSGYRTPSEQASAMLKKFAYAESKGKPGAEELHDIYGDDAAVDLLLRVPRSVEAWAAEIERLVAAGHSFSRHMRWGALDLSIRDLTSAQLDQVKAAVKSLGGRYLHESLPPHLHVDIPGSGSGTAPAATPQAEPEHTTTPPSSYPMAERPTSWLPLLVPMALVGVGAWWLAPVWAPFLVGGARAALAASVRVLGRVL